MTYHITRLSDPGDRRAVGDAAWLRLAAVLLGAGALGVLATSLCYAVAGPAAALPGGAVSLQAAREATAGAAGWMRAASLLGMPGDLLLAVGAAMLAVLRRDDALVFAGWAMLALTSSLFVIVDAMVGFVLPPLALAGAGSEAASAYAALRALFDALFLVGTWALGVGALAVAWRAGLAPRWAAWGLRGAGAMALASGAQGLLAWGVPALAGPSIALSVVMVMGLAHSLWRGARAPVLQAGEPSAAGQAR